MNEMATREKVSFLTKKKIERRVDMNEMAKRKKISFLTKKKIEPRNCPQR